MTRHGIVREPRVGKVAALLVAAATFAACAGENLFQAPAVGGSATVEIREPTDGTSVPLGDDLEVTARVTPGGGGDVHFIGVHPGVDATAYAPQTATVSGNLAVDLTATMVPAESQTTGEALIIVTLTPDEGDTVADTVSITVTN